MHARVTTLNIQPDKVNDSVRIYRDEILPVIKGQSGHRGVYLFIDSATGKALSVTLWNSEAEAQAYEAGGTYRQLVGKVAANFAAPPSLATFEVAVQG